MLICTGSLNGRYLVYDTDDGVTECVGMSELYKYLSKGIQFSNLVLNGENIVITDTSFVNSQLALFKKKGQVALTKLMVMKKDQQFQVNELNKLAQKLGLTTKDYRLRFDLDNCLVAFDFQGFIYRFDMQSSDNVNANKLSKINVCDESVVSLSKLGFDAFRYMMLNLGTKAEPNYTNLKECFDELAKVDPDFDEKHISYIGITPNNRMFKVYMDKWEIYSVQFCDINEMDSKRDEILKLGTTQGRFREYIDYRWYMGGNKVAVQKVSRKQYKKTVNELKKKYSTLQDVWVK